MNIYSKTVLIFIPQTVFLAISPRQCHRSSLTCLDRQQSRTGRYQPMPVPRRDRKKFYFDSTESCASFTCNEHTIVTFNHIQHVEVDFFGRIWHSWFQSYKNVSMRASSMSTSMRASTLKGIDIISRYFHEHDAN